MEREHLTTPWWALRATLGATAFLAGLDKFFNILVSEPAGSAHAVASRRTLTA
jgi:hypothetical protein